MLDPRFTLVSSTGAVQDRASFLAEVARREPRYSEFRNHDQTVRFYGDAGVIVGITSVHGTVAGKAFAADFRYTDTWTRKGDRWRLVASHASRIPSATSP